MPAYGLAHHANHAPLTELVVNISVTFSHIVVVCCDVFIRLPTLSIHRYTDKKFMQKRTQC